MAEAQSRLRDLFPDYGVRGSLTDAPAETPRTALLEQYGSIVEPYEPSLSERIYNFAFDALGGNTATGLDRQRIQRRARYPQMVIDQTGLAALTDYSQAMQDYARGDALSGTTNMAMAATSFIPGQQRQAVEEIANRLSKGTFGKTLKADDVFSLTDRNAAGMTPNMVDYQTADILDRNPNYFRESKDVDYEIIRMSPDEYLERAAAILRPEGKTIQYVIDDRAKESGYINNMAASMQGGQVYAAPYLDYGSGGRGASQEGMHRALAAKQLGMEEIPVMVLDSYKNPKSPYRSALNEMGTPAQGQSALPPLENAQKTQLGASTVPSYQKAKNILGGEKILDFGAGRGQGASVIGADTYEPYPREGFNPTYSNPADIPDASYKGVTSLNVLNVVPREVRDEIVTNIGRVMEPGGQAVITTRGRDVMSAKGDDGPEPMSRITTSGTYQKGFTQPELREYISGTLGPNYSVENLPEKIGAAGVLVKRLDTPAQGQSALRTVVTPSEIGFDSSYEKRVGEARKISGTPFRYEGEPPTPKEISIFDLEGRPFVTSMSDRSMAGTSLAGIGDVDFDIPVELLGGQGYMFGNPGELWAAARTPASSIYRTGELAGALGGTTAPPIYLPYRMGATGSDFSHMTTDTMLTYARNNMSPSVIKSADKDIKEILPEWKGIENPESMEQLSNVADSTRAKVRNLLDKKYRDEGGIGIGTARLAISDPSQYQGITGGIQNVGEFDLSSGISPSRHRSYPYAIPGQGIGTLKEKDINIYELMPELASFRGIDVTKPIPQSEMYTLQTGIKGAPGQIDPTGKARPFAGIITESALRNIENIRSGN